jgi:hypothetical protein
VVYEFVNEFESEFFFPFGHSHTPPRSWRGAMTST